MIFKLIENILGFLAKFINNIHVSLRQHQYFPISESLGNARHKLDEKLCLYSFIDYLYLFSNLHHKYTNINANAERNINIHHNKS